LGFLSALFPEVDFTSLASPFAISLGASIFFIGSAFGNTLVVFGFFLRARVFGLAGIRSCFLRAMVRLPGLPSLASKEKGSRRASRGHLLTFSGDVLSGSGFPCLGCFSPSGVEHGRVSSASKNRFVWLVTNGRNAASLGE
jgi:hypothetical protein